MKLQKTNTITKKHKKGKREKELPKNKKSSSSSRSKSKNTPKYIIINFFNNLTSRTDPKIWEGYSTDYKSYETVNMMYDYIGEEFVPEKKNGTYIFHVMIDLNHDFSETYYKVYQVDEVLDDDTLIIHKSKADIQKDYRDVGLDWLADNLD